MSETAEPFIRPKWLTEEVVRERDARFDPVQQGNALGYVDQGCLERRLLVQLLDTARRDRDALAVRVAELENWERLYREAADLNVKYHNEAYRLQLALSVEQSAHAATRAAVEELAQIAETLSAAVLAAVDCGVLKSDILPAMAREIIAAAAGSRRMGEE